MNIRFETTLVNMKTNTYLVFLYLWPRVYNTIKTAVLCYKMIIYKKLSLIHLEIYQID